MYEKKKKKKKERKKERKNKRAGEEPKGPKANFSKHTL